MRNCSRALVAGVIFLASIPAAVHGFPDFGVNCASCHGRPDGDLSFLPSSLLEIAPGDTGEITFDVTDVAAGVQAAISLEGLDAAGLMATPDLTNWNQQTDGTDNWLTSDTFGTTGPIILPLSIGSGALLGDYPISLILAGGAGADGGRWSTTRSFTVRVIPEPTTVALLSVGIASGALIARRRLFRRRSG